MKLLVSQKNILADIVEHLGYKLCDFEFLESSNNGCVIVVKSDKELLFNFRDSIQGAGYCDIYYKPTNKQSCKHIYLSIDTFEEVIPYFQEWLDCLSIEVGVEDKWSKTE